MRVFRRMIYASRAARERKTIFVGISCSRAYPAQSKMLQACVVAEGSERRSRQPSDRCGCNILSQFTAFLDETGLKALSPERAIARFTERRCSITDRHSYADCAALSR
jgi:hypothetical protein